MVFVENVCDFYDGAAEFLNGIHGVIKMPLYKTNGRKKKPVNGF